MPTQVELRGAYEWKNGADGYGLHQKAIANPTDSRCVDIQTWHSQVLIIRDYTIVIFDDSDGAYCSSPKTTFTLKFDTFSKKGKDTLVFPPGTYSGRPIYDVPEICKIIVRDEFASDAQ